MELQTQLEDIAAQMSYIGRPDAPINEVVIDSLMSSVIEDHHLGLDLTTLQAALENGEIVTLDLFEKNLMDKSQTQ